MLHLSWYIENKNNIQNKSTDLDIFKEIHFSSLISRLFDMYKSHPNQKIWNIIKKVLNDYINVINFIKESILNYSQWNYDTLLQTIWEKFWEKIKLLSDTDELKQYFTIYNNSNLLFSEWEHDANKILQLLNVDVSTLTWEINVTCEDGILCFSWNDCDMISLWIWDNANWWFLWNKIRYNNMFLPIILLKNNNSEFEWARNHEIQHYIFSTFNINSKKVQSKVDDMFKDEIIAQAIHSSKIIYQDRNWNYTETTRSFMLMKWLTENPDPYDFPFLLILEKIKFDYWTSTEQARKYFQERSEYRNMYLSIWDRILRREFNVDDRFLFARKMVENIPDSNLILTLTPFDNREQLRDIYKDDIVSE